MRRTPLLLIFPLLGACNAETGLFRTAGGPPQPVRVELRDRESGAPIAGAAVVAETVARNHPMSIASAMWKTMPEDTRGRTDVQGRITLSVLEGREFRIFVWAPGRTPVAFWPVLESHADIWLEPELPPGEANPGVQARITTRAAGEAR